MALKISFESDIKGFERVQKALEDQGKLLNQNADAVERLQKAQAGLSGQAMDIKSSESLKGTANQIKGLVDSLDLLTSKRTGFKSIINMFGEFGTEVNKLNADKSVDIFKAMGAQIDVLKNNMRGTSELMRNFRQERDELQAQGKGKEAQEKTAQINELASKQLGEHDMLKKLERSQLWRKPLMQFGGGGDMPPGGDGTAAGFFQGGTSMQGALGAAGIAGAILKATEVIAKRYVNVAESGLTARETLFNRDVSIARAAQEGQGARQFMQSQGLGEEANFLAGGRFTDKGGSFDLTQTGRTVGMAGKQFWGAVTGNYKDSQQILAEEAERISGLEGSQRFGLDAASTFEKTLSNNPNIKMADQQYGSDKVRNVVRSLARQGITSDEASTGIRSLARLGVLGNAQPHTNAAPEIANLEKAISKITDAKTIAAATPEKGFLADKMDQLKGFFGVKASSEATFSKTMPGLLSEKEKSDKTELENKIKDLKAVRHDTGGGSLKHLFQDPSTLMMTERGQEEMRRQYAIGGATRGSLRKYEADLGRARTRLNANGEPVEVVTAQTDYLQNITSNIRGGGSDKSNEAAGQTMFMAKQAMAGMEGMTPMEKAQTAMQAQSNLQGEMGTPGTGLSMGTDFALVRLGIKNSVDRAAIVKLISEGRPEDAAKLAAALSGKDIATVKSELNMAVTAQRKMQDQVSGTDAASTAAYKSVGLGSRAEFTSTGTTIGANAATNEGDAARRAGLIYDTKTKPGVVPAMNAETQMTNARQFSEAQAGQEAQLGDTNKQLAQALGTELRNVVVQNIVEGYRTIADKMAESITSMGTMGSGGKTNTPPPAAHINGGQKKKD